jgi:tape measure domain-containing protein
MPKTIRNAVETRFTADDRMTRQMSRMNRAMNRMNRIAGRIKRGFLAAGRAALFLGRALMTGLKVGIGIAVAGIGALTAAVWKFSSSFSMIEDATAQFTPLMGSVKKAKDLVDALNQTAATTPFQFETLSDTAKQLLPSMNGDIEKTIKTTRMLGDTAGGNAQKLDSITRGYNKALLKGNVDLEALNMIAEAGVPIFQQLGNVTGKSGEKLFKNISAGKVSVDDLTETFKVMTSKGGIFFGGMEIASKTLTGKISTLKDNVTLVMAEFGEAMAPTLKEVADNATLLAQKIGNWAKENKALIAQKFHEYFNLIVDNGKKAFYFLRENVPPLIDNLKRIGREGFAWIRDNREELKSFGALALDVGRAFLKVAEFVIRNKEAVLIIIGAYKALGISMSLINFSQAASGVGSIGAASGGASVALGKMAGVLGKGGVWGAAVIAAGALGVSIGTEISDAFNRSLDSILTKANNVSSQIGLMVSKMNNIELDVALKQQQNVQKEQDSLWTGVKSLFTGRMQERDDARTASRQAQIDILKEQKRRLGAEMRSKQMGTKRLISGAFKSAAPSVSDEMVFSEQEVASAAKKPQVQMSRSESTKTERIEVVIRDETGRAEVVKGGHNKGFKLADSGAY